MIYLLSYLLIFYKVPSFVNNNEAIYNAGIDNIICVAAAEPYTLRSWEYGWDPEQELVSFIVSSFLFLFSSSFFPFSINRTAAPISSLVTGVNAALFVTGCVISLVSPEGI